MRSFLGMLLVTGLLVGLESRTEAGDREEALAVLDAAIKAHGGQDALARVAQMVRKDTGVFSAGGKDVPISDELIMALPDRFRLTVAIGTDPGKHQIVQIFNGDKGWTDLGSKTEEVSREKLAMLREDAQVLWAATLVPLKKNDTYQIAPLPQDKRNGEVLGIKATRRDYPVLNLYFDKKSNLLVKIAWKTKEFSTPVEKEMLLSEHKEIDGVQLPMRIVELHNGKSYTDLRVDAYRFLKRADDSQFSKP